MSLLLLLPPLPLRIFPHLVDCWFLHVIVDRTVTAANALAASAAGRDVAVIAAVAIAAGCAVVVVATAPMLGIGVFTLIAASLSTL